MHQLGLNNIYYNTHPSVIYKLTLERLAELYKDLVLGS